MNFVRKKGSIICISSLIAVCGNNKCGFQLGVCVCVCVFTCVRPDTSPFGSGAAMEGVKGLLSSTGRPFIKCLPAS